MPQKGDSLEFLIFQTTKEGDVSIDLFETCYSCEL